MQEKQVKNTFCATCGADMKFDPVTGNLKCEYCNSTEEIERDKTIEENSYGEFLNKNIREWNQDDVTTAVCSKCGATLVFDSHIQSKTCSYCGSASVNIKKFEHTISPGYVLPFSIEKKVASENFNNWIKKRWFAPNNLKKLFRLENLSGLYIPFWTYDANTYTNYTADRGTYYYVTKTRTVDGKTETYQERHTSWSSVNGSDSKFFDDLLVIASQKLDSGILSKVKNFDMKEIAKYKPEFLSGFVAERYSISLEDGWKKAQIQAENQIEQQVRTLIGGDEIRNLNIDTEYSEIKFKHVLLPLWISSFIYKEKSYSVMINGYSGEVEGDYPKSIVKIMSCILGIAAVIGFIYFLLQ